MKKTKIVCLTIVSIIGSSHVFAMNASSNFDTTAKIESFCSINVGDINFGVVSLPLTAQSANTQMKVRCSNNTNYDINLSYGGKYGTGTSGTYTTQIYNSSDNMSFHVIYKDGIKVSSENADIWCEKGVQGVRFNSKEAALFYGYSESDISKVVKDNNICSGAELNINVFNEKAKSAGIAYDYGVMNGQIRKDILAYQIKIPSDSSKVWNKGINSYKSQGTGTEQTIELNAEIVPDKSSSKYLAQDAYLDTVIAEIAY